MKTLIVASVFWMASDLYFNIALKYLPLYISLILITRLMLVTTDGKNNT